MSRKRKSKASKTQRLSALLEWTAWKKAGSPSLEPNRQKK